MTRQNVTRPTAVVSSREPIGRAKPASERRRRFGACKCFRKHQDRTSVVKRRHYDQVFRDRIFLIHGADELLQTRNRHVKADTTHAATQLQSKDRYLFIFRGDFTIPVEVIDDERKGRRMCEHVCNGRAVCTDEGKTQRGCRREYESSPSLANLRGLIPPASMAGGKYLM